MKKRVFAAIVLVFTAVLLFDLWISKYGLMKTVYEVTSEELDATVVLLTDTHGSRFGKHNERLVSRVRKAKPDLIAVAGDMLTYDEDHAEEASELVSALSEIAPVYVSYGNHEELQLRRPELRELFAEAGAEVLDFGYEDIELHGVPVRIGGLYGYALPEGNEAERKNESKFLREFQNTESYKILLTHMPYAWTEQGSLEYWDIDLVLSGHLHGGQIIFPFAGGLYAPDQGFFPGKVWGMRKAEDGKSSLIISRGLGSSVRWLPRFDNIPEIVVVEIRKKTV